MKLGIIGEKLGHTASPAIHEAFFRQLGIGGTYTVLEMERSQLAEKLQRLAEAGYVGVNVTIPYKVEVIPFLTNISREAKIIGAVNTIHFTKQGAIGYNTDYWGFGRSLQHAKINVKGQRCVVLGTGGAARAIVQYLADNQAASVTVVSRRPQANTDFSAFAHKTSAALIDYTELSADGGGDVLINCTPVGMFPNTDGCPVSTAVIAAFPAVVDIIYNPRRTRLLQVAEMQGARILNGMYMLVAQAMAAEEIWLDQPVDASVTAEIVREMECNDQA